MKKYLVICFIFNGLFNDAFIILLALHCLFKIVMNTLSTTGPACRKYDTKRGGGDGPDIFKSSVPFTHRLPTISCGPQRGKDFVEHNKYFFKHETRWMPKRK